MGHTCCEMRTSEDCASYCIRVARLVRNTLERYTQESWDAFYHRLVFSWGGHVQRISKYDPSRLTFQVLKFRNWAWIQNIADQNNGQQLHGRRLHVWRWERPLYSFFRPKGLTWEQQANDNVNWETLLDIMVEWRTNHC